VGSFAAWVRKESLEGARSYRFLILAVAAAFFAFLDPAMLKLLPLIMKAQVGADLSSLISASRDAAFESFVGDGFEILSLVVCLVLGGIVAKERKERGFVIPVSKGAGFAGIVAAKAFVAAAYLAVILAASVFVSYLYAGLLFPGTEPVLALPARAALNLSLYFAWVVALVVFMSSIARSGVVASLLSAAVVYGVPALASLLRAQEYVPSYLATGSASVASLARASYLPSTLSAAAAAVAFLICSVVVLERAEI
jgi:ABC-2 type transport system permease protein